MNRACTEADARQEPRQLLWDLLQLYLRGDFTAQRLLLFLSLLNVFGVIELVGRCPNGGEGQFLNRLLGLVRSFGEGARSTDEDATRGGPRRAEGASVSGGKEGLQALTALLSNPDVLQMVFKLLQWWGGTQSPASREPDGSLKQRPPARSGRRPEVIYWNFGRNTPGKGKGNSR
ncbi:MAG: hypothetical protein AB1426_06835 [Bacillota bacterium]